MKPYKKLYNIGRSNCPAIDTVTVYTHVIIIDLCTTKTLYFFSFIFYIILYTGTAAKDSQTAYLDNICLSITVLLSEQDTDIKRAEENRCV